MRHGGAGEALEGGRVGVDAEGDAVRVDLVLDEAVQLLLHLGHAGEISLPVVVEGALRHLIMGYKTLITLLGCSDTKCDKHVHHRCLHV